MFMIGSMATIPDDFPPYDHGSRATRAVEREMKLDEIAAIGVRFLRGMAEQPIRSLEQALALVDAFDRLARSVRQTLTTAARQAADNVARAQSQAGPSPDNRPPPDDRKPSAGSRPKLH